MGSSPPPSSSSPLPQSRPLSFAHFLSPASDLTWLMNSDRDTEILTQALTREISSCNGGLASSSVFPSASCSAPSTLYSNSFNGRTWQSQTSQAPLAARAFQQQQQNAHYHHQERQQHHQQPQQHHQQPQQHQQQVTPVRFRADGYSHLDQTSLQNGSPLSTNSSPRPLSVSTETPPSPFSTISTNSAIATVATDGLFDHSQSQHQDSQDGSFLHAMAPSYKPPEISSMYSGSSISARAASMGLSSQASAGAGASKVNKKRSRATSKAPIAVLSADTSNFRAMVQRLTGIPSSSYPHAGIPLLKPQPIRHPMSSTSNLPTLDTSAGFLGSKYLKEGFSFMQRQHQGLPGSGSASASASASPFPGRSREDFDLQSQVASYGKQSIFNEQGSSTNHSFSSSSPGLPTSLWSSADSLRARANPSAIHEGEQISGRRNPIPSPTPPPSALDSLPMDEYLPSKSSFNAVDSWLSFDAPTMELARMA